jgi:N-acetylglutamate synthase-like GNAT family acetyltransferase
MDMKWTRESNPHWDEAKAAIVGDAPEGIFDTRYRDLKSGESAPGEWWKVEADGDVVGFGWMDVVWGDAEILVATAANARGKGVGAFIMENLSREAKAKGLAYVYNVVRPNHPDKDKMGPWLSKLGFSEQADGRWTKAAG